MKVVDRKRTIGSIPVVIESDLAHVQLELRTEHNGIEIYSLSIDSSIRDEHITIQWRVPAIDIKGSWSPNLLLDKRLRADWEDAQLESSVSNDAPVLCLYSHADQNRITFACSDTKNALSLEAGLQEEDNHVYCSFRFSSFLWTESDYSCLLWIDRREQHFAEGLKDASEWMKGHLSVSVCPVPDAARLPVYSTWYSYHQDFTAAQLLDECQRAHTLGYRVLIVDDGWQTMDDRRGYDYTGDWESERLQDSGSFVQAVHALDMKVMFWFSVPFCGVLSEAYQRFEGKFLTENHHWAPVFDPRFPEVRQYLVSRYARAIGEWGCDGLKLDFIDDFKVYPETEMKSLNGRDTLSVPEGVNRLLLQIRRALEAINPDVLIEFRQKYISPRLQIVGNMFRAFDCPNDSTLNRVRTTDVKMLCGVAAVHSDMITWHPDESVEVAALQLTSILFSVPQLSIRLADASPAEIAMIGFYTGYWLANRDTLLDGDFIPSQPLANYPILSAKSSAKHIYGIYEDIRLHLDEQASTIDLVNGKMSPQVLLSAEFKGEYSYTAFDCQGETKEEGTIHLSQDVQALDCPSSGLLVLQHIK